MGNQATEVPGPRTAILLSTTTPPEGILSINGTPILLRALDTKKRTAGSLIAGPPQQKRTPENNDVDFLQTNDPWAKSSAPSTSSDTRPPLPRRRQEQSVQNGPVEQQLKEHESEILSLKKSIQQLTEAQDTFASNTGAMFDGIRNKRRVPSPGLTKSRRCCSVQCSQRVRRHRSEQSRRASRKLRIAWSNEDSLYYAVPSEGFIAPEGMLDCSEYEWPGSAKKPGLNHQLIQSACHQGSHSSAPIVFRRNCGTRAEQVARPACDERGSPPTCMFLSCAVEKICIRIAEELFTHADSASDVRRCGFNREPINWGWIGVRGMQRCIQKTHATESFRIRCVPGSNCETQEAICSQINLLHSTKSLQITMQLDGVGVARVCAMPQYCEYHVEEREQPCQSDIKSGSGRPEFMQMSDFANCQLEPSIAICELASFSSGCLSPQCCPVPEGSDLKSRHQTVTKSGTPSAPNRLPFLELEQSAVQGIETMAITVRSTLAEKKARTRIAECAEDCHRVSQYPRQISYTQHAPAVTRTVFKCR